MTARAACSDCGADNPPYGMPVAGTRAVPVIGRYCPEHRLDGERRHQAWLEGRPYSPARDTLAMEQAPDAPIDQAYSRGYLSGRPADCPFRTGSDAWAAFCIGIHDREQRTEARGAALLIGHRSAKQGGQWLQVPFGRFHQVPATYHVAGDGRVTVTGAGAFTDPEPADRKGSLL